MPWFPSNSSPTPDDASGQPRHDPGTPPPIPPFSVGPEAHSEPTRRRGATAWPTSRSRKTPEELAKSKSSWIGCLAVLLIAAVIFAMGSCAGRGGASSPAPATPAPATVTVTATPSPARKTVETTPTTASVSPTPAAVVPAPAPNPKPAPDPDPKPNGLVGGVPNGNTEPDPAPAAVYYKNCDAARAAGAAPLHRGQPGYRSELDRDGDGIACEPKKR